MKKVELLQILSEKIAQCVKCPELCENRERTIPGYGNAFADVFICGEAGGSEELKQGKPFVGKAGELLTSALKVCGWEREEVYITNVLMCRPPNNRTPTQEESDNCSDFVRLQLEIVKPKVMILLGATAINRFCGPFSVAQMRGTTFDYEGRGFKAKAFPTWHPAYLFHHPQDKPRWVEDLMCARRYLEELYS